MKPMTKWLTLGSIAAAGAIGTTLLRRRSLERRATSRYVIVGAEFDDVSVAYGGEIPEAIADAGIADVDPEPLAQVAGEGIDVDAVAAAHTELRDLRERLPRPGKNLP